MGRQSGLDLIQELTKAMKDEEKPCNTIAEMFERATTGRALQNALARDVLEWNNSWKPIPSFLRYIETNSKIAEEEAREEQEAPRDERPKEGFFESSEVKEAITAGQPIEHTQSPPPKQEVIATVRERGERVRKRVVTYNVCSL